MANPYFDALHQPQENELIGELVTDLIYDRGVEFKYIVREQVHTDEVMNEQIMSKFEKVYSDIDVYIEPENSQYMAPNTFLDSFGFNYENDSVRIHFDRRKFLAVVGELPKEGCLLYLERLDRFYEITDVDSRDVFQSGGDFFSLIATITLFRPGEGMQVFGDDVRNLSNVVDRIVTVNTPNLLDNDSELLDELAVGADGLSDEQIEQLQEMEDTFRSNSEIEDAVDPEDTEETLIESTVNSNNNPFGFL